MINRKQFLSACIGLILTSSLTACTGIAADRKEGDSKEKTEDALLEEETKVEDAADDEEQEEIVLTVATTTDPYAAILEDFAKDQLAERNATLKIAKYKSVEEANAATASGKTNASFCLRHNELDPYTGDSLPNLSSAGDIFYEPYGVFSSKHDSLREIQQGMTVAIPGSDEGRGRALLLLQQEGVIRLNDPKKLDSHTYELAENPKEIQFREADNSQLPALSEEVDYVILDPSDIDDLSASDAIAIEASDGVAAKRYAGAVAIDPDKVDDAEVAAIVKVLKSKEFDTYLQAAYGQDLIPIT